MATKLSNATLATIGKSVAVPRYDRQKLTAGILHFGVGNFHRAHQAVYLDDLFNLGRDLDFGIIGAGLRATTRGPMSKQDFLTTVVEQEADSSRARVIGAIPPSGLFRSPLPKAAISSIRLPGFLTPMIRLLPGTGRLRTNLKRFSD